MLIAGFDPDSQKVTNLHSWVFPIGGRIYDIHHRIVPDDELNGLENSPMIITKTL